jgi:hypothetical protein
MASKRRPRVQPGAPVPTAIRRLIVEGGAGVDSGRLLSDLIEAWGGSTRLAQDIVSEFNRASPGGATRQKILEMIQRLIVINTQNEIARPAAPGEMTNEELEAAVALYMHKAQANGPETTVAAEAEGTS